VRQAGEAEADEVYVWWAKLRSQNRQETHLDRTDYRSLYVARLAEITDQSPLEGHAGEIDHMPA
jgi:hypothetical protein